MKKLMARYNAGRWLVDCPDGHGSDGAVLALDYRQIDPSQSPLYAENNIYICPQCYPGFAAQVAKIRRGQIVKEFDKSARATARSRAEADGKAYQVVFPKDREQIESILAERPRLQRNWDGPHESPEKLREENAILEAVKNGI